MSSVLVIDDDPLVREVMVEWVTRLGHEAREAGSTDEALAQMAASPAGIVICDVNMPGRDGVWLTAQLRKAFPDTAIVMVTGNQDATVALSTLRLGAVDFLSKPFDGDQFRSALARGVRWQRDAEQSRQRLNVLETEVRERLAAVETFLIDRPIASDIDLEALLLHVVPEDAGVTHARRVSMLATNVAVNMGIRSPELDDIERAALLHDLGRATMPVTILTKPARLSEEEIAIVRQQPRRVAEILVRMPFLANVAGLVRTIFEHVDGDGYPFGLRGEEIPRGARIIAVADALDAMTHPRPYRDMRTAAEAVFEVKRCAGTHFDPAVVEALLSVVHLHWERVARKFPPDRAGGRTVDNTVKDERGY